MFYCLLPFAISFYLLSSVNELKEKYSLKRKKQPVRVLRENTCVLKEVTTTRLQIIF